jgi:hypothetical protein
MQAVWNPKMTSARIRAWAKVGAFLLIALYTWIYLSQPFSDLWNTILTNVFLVIVSSLAALMGTLIWVHYDRTDAPRRIWGSFAIGLWLWAAAELIWGVLNVTQGEVPEGISDVFWIAAYLFFGFALFLQYQLVARPTRGESISRGLTALLMLLAIYLLIYDVLTSGAEPASRFGALVNSFYPAGDFVLALAALWLANHFMGGVFSRPWLGLLAFSFTDLMYAWLEISGLYSWSVKHANPLSTIFDITYLGAYLVLGLGVLSQWTFLRYGLRSRANAR